MTTDKRAAGALSSSAALLASVPTGATESPFRSAPPTTPWVRSFALHVTL